MSVAADIMGFTAPHITGDDLNAIPENDYKFR